MSKESEKLGIMTEDDLANLRNELRLEKITNRELADKSGESKSMVNLRLNDMKYYDEGFIQLCYDLIQESKDARNESFRKSKKLIDSLLMSA